MALKISITAVVEEGKKSGGTERCDLSSCLADIGKHFNEKKLDGGSEIFRPGNCVGIVSMCLGYHRVHSIAVEGDK